MRQSTFLGRPLSATQSHSARLASCTGGLLAYSLGINANLPIKSPDTGATTQNHSARLVSCSGACLLIKSQHNVQCKLT